MSFMEQAFLREFKFIKIQWMEPQSVVKYLKNVPKHNTWVNVKIMYYVYYK